MSRKKKQKHSEEEGGEAWLLPYSDLMTLLLAVFIVLFAVSKVDESKAEEAAQAFRKNMMTGSGGFFTGEGDSIVSQNPDGTNEETTSNESDTEASLEDPSTSEEVTAAPQEDSNPSEVAPTTTEGNTDISREELENFLGTNELETLERIEGKLQALLKSEGMSATINIDTRGLVISLNNAILFESGSAELRSEHKDTLNKISEIMNAVDNYIRVEGHTDNVPINTNIYPSNWELSTARAASVVRLFIDECDVSPEKIVAVGYGEYKPIANNSTEEGREKNRRIDIIVLSEKYDNLEKQIIE